MASAVMSNTTNTHSSRGAPRRHETPSIDSYPSKYNPSYPMHASSAVKYSAASHTRPSNVSKLKTSFEQSFVLPDIDDEDSMYPPCNSVHAQDLGRPPRLQPPPRLTLASITPGVVFKKSKRSPSSDRSSPPGNGNSEERAAMALRRAENRPETTVVAFRGEWEMRQHRKEPKRTSERQRSPQSAKSDEGWGSSMYDVEVDGRR